MESGSRAPPYRRRMESGLGDAFGRYLDIWNTGRTDALGEILSGDYRGHVYGSVREERDQIALAAYITKFRAGLPNARFEIEMQFGAADCLATRLTMTTEQSLVH